MFVNTIDSIVRFKRTLKTAVKRGAESIKRRFALKKGNSETEVHDLQGSNRQDDNDHSGHSVAFGIDDDSWSRYIATLPDTDPQTRPDGSRANPASNTTADHNAGEFLIDDPEPAPGASWRHGIINHDPNYVRYYRQGDVRSRRRAPMIRPASADLESATDLESSSS
ncbi:MAG: hypothetical protein Q9163_001810 [Psora crenata]